MQTADMCCQQNQVATATPENLLLMLHDGAIRYIAESRQAIEGGSSKPKGESVGKAMAIVSCLADTLDHEAGWEHSEDLDGLYGFMIKELTKANLHDDLQSLTVVEGLLQGLRGSWAEAIEIVRRENTQLASTFA